MLDYSKSKKTFLLWLCCLVFSFQPALAQSPYQLQAKTELISGGVAAASFGLGLWSKNSVPLFTKDELLTLDKEDVNRFDRIATEYHSLQAHEASDYLLYGSHALSFLFLANKTTRREFGKIQVMYVETAITNLGLTMICKGLFKRPRPFVFDFENNEALIAKKSARASFLSGHTSSTATNTFFAAKVFSDYFPDSKWKPVVWGAAILIPAATGYFRVRAGRHYPTDVIAGYALGATVGFFVPHFHRSKVTQRLGITSSVGLGYAAVRWNFSQKNQPPEFRINFEN